MMGKESAEAKEEEEVVPEHLRCNRNDGKKWRCRLRVTGNLKVCRIHKLQGHLRSHKEKVPDSLKLRRKKEHKNNHIAVFKMRNKMDKKKPKLSSDGNNVNGMEGEGEGSSKVDITGYNLENRICKLETLIAKFKAAKLGSEV